MRDQNYVLVTQCLGGKVSTSNMVIKTAFEESKKVTTKNNSSSIACFATAKNNQKENKAKDKVYKAASNLNW